MSVCACECVCVDIYVYSDISVGQTSEKQAFYPDSAIN